MSSSPVSERARGLHRVISDSEGVVLMDDASSPQSTMPPAAVYVDPNSSAAVVDDDPMDEDSLNMGVVPRNLAAQPRSVSSDSSLSDASAGLIPEAFKQDRTIESVQAAQFESQNVGLLPVNSQPELYVQSSNSRTRLMIVSSPLHKQVGGSLPSGLHRMDDSASSESLRARSENSSNDWGYGWYEDVHTSENIIGSHRSSDKRTNKKGGLISQSSIRGEVQDELHLLPHKDSQDAAAMAVTAPTYVLEESLSTQELWKHTAGQRPPQPVEERAFYEKMWAQNFARSQVKYSLPVEVLTATSPICLSPFAEGIFEVPSARSDYTSTPVQPKSSDQGAVAEATLVSLMNDPNQHGEEDGIALPRKVRGYGSDGDLTILGKGVNAFGTTVSKSFARSSSEGGGIVTVNVSIASYRVVESRKSHKYAQFLVIYREGSIRDTFGVWKRYRDFEELARKVTHAHEGCAAVIANVSPLAVTEEPETEHLPNAITSWRLLKKRQRWFRCLDAGYLSLKVFLLERFLHDILFESSSPKLLRDFVGAGNVFNSE